MKEAYYFSHDANARHDPKIKAMRSVYGLLGYAWFWILIEMLRESDGFKLDMRSKYAFHAFASELHCEIEKAQAFIKDCIEEFGLFESDGNNFWSPSLLRRMQKKQEISDKARKSAEARWGKKTAEDQGVSDSEGSQEMQDECDRIENECESDALKESKGNENKRKRKEIKKKYAEFVSMTEDEHQKLVDQYGPDLTNEMVSVLDNYKGSKGRQYKSDYRAILSWVVDKVTKKDHGQGKKRLDKAEFLDLLSGE